MKAKTLVLCAAIVAACALLAGCETVPPLQTQSGKPERIFVGVSDVRLRAAIIGIAMRNHYTLARESQTQLSFERPTEGMEGMIGQKRIADVMMLKERDGEIRVVVELYYTTSTGRIAAGGRADSGWMDELNALQL